MADLPPVQILSLVKRMLAAALAVGFAAGALACTGSVSNEDVASGSGGDTSAENGGEGAPAAGTGGAPGMLESVNELVCPKAGPVGTAEAPLRRLTNVQYVNTLRSLFAGAATVPADLALPGETTVGGFDNNTVAQTSSLSLLQGYQSAASAMAKAATGSANAMASLAPCAGGADAGACGDQFIRTFGKRAYRRPLLPDEAARLSALFKASLTSLDYPQAVEVTTRAMLMSPQFVFREERGTASAAGAPVVQLTSYEVAGRLSYLLWDTMPDAALMAAADSNKLDDVAGIEEQAKRLLADDQAKATIARFAAQWMGLSRMSKITKDPTAFPSFTPAVKTSLQDSVQKYLDYAFWTNGTLAGLLTDTHTFVDANLAPLYEVKAPGGGLTLVELNDNKHSGILTQAGIMASLAKPAVDSPVYRGVFVLEALLCAPTGAPPANVPALLDPKAGEAPSTTRQRQEQSHNKPVCAGCHKSIDGLGFAFEHFDALGQYRDTENGVNVDSSGELVGTRDIDGKFDGVVELGKKLATSTQVQQCVATQWFRYGFGQTETDADACALKPIVDAFIASKGSLQGLLLATVKSDGFRFRNQPMP